MVYQMRRGFFFVGASLIATSASGQEAYFHPLEIPPNSAGTCIPISNKADRRASVTGHLLIKSVVPGQDRDMSVLVDTLHRTVGYFEFEMTTSGRLGSTVGDTYVASFKNPGREMGFAMNSVTKMPIPDFDHLDSVSIRKLGEYSRTVSTKRPLNADEQKHAREIAEWLRKRCPT